ncbi:hypothetical protein J6590_022284 [Homalodisca vitripennis]|nr:hypothetical protein J6590_022284 [Homalodisca vitripennis]
MKSRYTSWTGGIPHPRSRRPHPITLRYQHDMLLTAASSLLVYARFTLTFWCKSEGYIIDPRRTCYLHAIGVIEGRVISTTNKNPPPTPPTNPKTLGHESSPCNRCHTVILYALHGYVLTPPLYQFYHRETLTGVVVKEISLILGARVISMQLVSYSNIGHESSPCNRCHTVILYALHGYVLTPPLYQFYRRETLTGVVVKEISLILGARVISMQSVSYSNIGHESSPCNRCHTVILYALHGYVLTPPLYQFYRRETLTGVVVKEISLILGARVISMLSGRCRRLVSRCLAVSTRCAEPPTPGSEPWPLPPSLPPISGQITPDVLVLRSPCVSCSSDNLMSGSSRGKLDRRAIIHYYGDIETKGSIIFIELLYWNLVGVFCVVCEASHKQGNLCISWTMKELYPIVGWCWCLLVALRFALPQSRDLGRVTWEPAECIHSPMLMRL